VTKFTARKLKINESSQYLSVYFLRLNAKLNDIRMTKLHSRWASWRHRRLLAVTYYRSTLATILRVNFY